MRMPFKILAEDISFIDSSVAHNVLISDPVGISLILKYASHAQRINLRAPAGTMSTSNWEWETFEGRRIIAREALQFSSPLP